MTDIVRTATHDCCVLVQICILLWIPSLYLFQNKEKERIRAVSCSPKVCTHRQVWHQVTLQVACRCLVCAKHVKKALLHAACTVCMSHVNELSRSVQSCSAAVQHQMQHCMVHKLCKSFATMFYQHARLRVFCHTLLPTFNNSLVR